MMIGRGREGGVGTGLNSGPSRAAEERPSRSCWRREGPCRERSESVSVQTWASCDRGIPSEEGPSWAKEDHRRGMEELIKRTAELRWRCEGGKCLRWEGAERRGRGGGVPCASRER